MSPCHRIEEGRFSSMESGEGLESGDGVHWAEPRSVHILLARAQHVES